MGELVVSVVGGKRLARALVRASQATGPEIDRARRQTGDRAVVIMRGVAPKRTGRLAGSIMAKHGGAVTLVTSSARNPETGYPYTGVTRFGHRVARIAARPGGVLRFTIGGRVFYRKSVAGYRPGKDWVERGLPAVALYARGALRQAGERILRVAG